MANRFRHAKSADIPNAANLLKAEASLFSNATWAEMPRILGDLLGCDLIKLVVIEETDTGRLRMMGASGFVDPHFLSHALKLESQSLPEACLSAVLKHESPFVSAKQVAAQNACGSLAMLNFLGTPDNTDLSDPESFDLHRLTNESHRFFHTGYQLSEFYMESTFPEFVPYLLSFGATLVKERQLPNGAIARLVRGSLEALVRKPGAGMSYLFKAPLPRLAFSRVEQQVLEHALLDQSDRDTAANLGLSNDAIKKRWRSIYVEVDRVDPSLAPVELPGADRRRTLLGYLRQHLEEIRPFAHEGYRRSNSPSAIRRRQDNPPAPPRHEIN